MNETSASIGNLGYSYDANGNRLSLVENGETKTYGYSPNSNRLIQIGHKEVTLDAAGNTVSDRNGKRRFEYLASSRLFKVYKERKQVATYLYNAQGQRTQKITKHGTTIYHYDLNGHLIAETSKSGTLQRAYVWLDDMPLVQVDVKGKEHEHRRKPRKERTAYLHTDHLGTPRLATDANQQVVWRWDSDAFGTEKPEHDDEVDDDHKDITVNLRFAGQYFDKETKLHYNWNRYYDPKTGRYVTSDPIGLEGGLNTYLYARANPLRYTDPTGLDVTITYFPGGPGHIGVGVNSSNTSGLYPRQRSIVVAFCRDVPGAALPDQERQDQTSIARSRSVTIRTTPAQDTVVQTFIQNARNNQQQEYNLCSNQCTGFVRGALQAGGIPVPGDSNSIMPGTFFNQIEREYGGRQQ